MAGATLILVSLTYLLTYCIQSITLCFVYAIKWTKIFEYWINQLSDKTTRIRLLRRLEKAQRGLLGDVKPVGECVYEMREFYGPGWRMYYMKHGDQLIIMLGGGESSV